jgi:hypothetical protein
MPSSVSLVDRPTGTHGTQDVNDRSRGRPRSGARHGVVHVLGSVSTLIGTPDMGGRERRPIDSAATSCNSVPAEHIAARTSVADDCGDASGLGL